MASGSQAQCRRTSASSASGYDYKFVDEPSNDLKCLICLCVARDPLQHGGEGCGKIFCRRCITEHQKKSKKCPNCRGKIVTFRDVRSERDIRSLRVKCENEGDGCEWVGELHSLKNRHKNCGYIKVPCPNKCHDTIQIIRKDLKKHLDEECERRQHTCPHCEKVGEYLKITGHHKIICPKMEIKCQNAECKTAFLREDEQNHLSICPYEKVACKYKDFGCEETSLRRDLAAHEDDDKAHLRMAMDTLLATNKQCTELKNENTKLQAQLRLQTSYRGYVKNLIVSPIFKIHKFAEKKEKDMDYLSPPFFTHPQGYKMTICIDTNGYGESEGTHVSVWACLMKGDYDYKLEFPFKGTITFELLNQLEDSNHHKDSYTYDGTEDCAKRVVGKKTARKAQGVEAFIPHSELGFSTAKNCQYLKNDCLVFRISVDVPSYKPWLQCTCTPSAEISSESSTSSVLETDSD